jgi:hypothetical protein
VTGGGAAGDGSVAPGPVYTPMVYQRGMSPAARDQRRKASALGIDGAGHTLVVDGGTTLTAPARRRRLRRLVRARSG